MAEKKKMSVAEILAAARKTDNKSGGAAPDASGPTSAAPASVPEPASEVAAAVPVAEPAAPAATTEQPAAKPKPATAGGARPSVADIMKLARQGGGTSPAPKPAAAKPEAKPAAPKPAPKPAAAATKVAEKPGKPAVAGAKDTASILAAARKTDRPGPMSKSEAAARLRTEPVAPTKPGKPAVPPMPAKPSAALPKTKAVTADDDRRGFLSFAVGSFLGLGFTSLSATVGLWTLGTARFMFPNVLIEPPSKFKVGFPGDFAPGMVEEKFKAQFGVWVVKAEYQGQMQIYALRSVCTHLGCTPNWLEGEQKFKCPCHGSGFYKDGINFEGPAPRPLERYAIQLAGDGQLEIDKSKTFQEEMGQWKDATCFVPV